MVLWNVRTETRQYAADSDLVRSCDEIGWSASVMGGIAAPAEKLRPTRST
jgi:hypothetical protein